MSQREIKFRVWDMESKKMSNPFGLAHGDSYIFGNEQVMQFTGLLDEDGTDVFEGDICSNEYVTLEVHYDQGCFYWGREPGIRLSEVVETIQVTGNIYENQGWQADNHK